MTPWLQDADVTLYHGDVLDVLAELPSESVDCVVTSPPYWGLRDYGNDGQIGLEDTPDAYVATLVSVFTEVRRVLASHGTCFINLGDSYAQGNKGNSGEIRPGEQGTNAGSLATRRGAGLGPNRNGGTSDYCKPKDLVGIPWAVAFALRADGWWLRSDIIWAKPNPMPESVTDRPTKAHEYVFLLTKAPRYWFDQEAVREGAEGKPQRRLTAAEDHPQGNPPGTFRKGLPPGGGLETSRNVRSVWTVATQPYPEAHFATYPEELVRRCVLAGCPERVCRVCGKPSERIVDVSYEHVNNTAPRQHSSYVASQGRVANKIATTTGWSDCGHNTWRPGLVLDPFAGSGTTCKVARDHGRHSIGIDLSQEYLELAARRLQQQSLLSELA